jgi:3-deoxy-7-phosphoheptulonate synthase
MNAIPAVHSLRNLLIVADPSHSTEGSFMVRPMAATEAGADGLIIEVHPKPNLAKCDGAQSLTFDSFSGLMRSVSAIRETVTASN